ncbi:hypothetical protein CK203_101630 [Vitis vinifera]|uniref:Uncharacterized protein n=1 Tax=Vitis vinifera TaxID=29760 RepID=A0A438DYT9_VITVI|nr:hypothetical protein CK203_101630 [Vitis vinifera]
MRDEAILTSTKPWKDDSWKENDKCKPCSKKQGSLEKKTMCYGSSQPTIKRSRGKTLGITKGQRVLERRGTSFFESLVKKPPTTMDDLFRRPRTNTQCWKMMYAQPPNKSWLPDNRPKMTRKGVPNIRTSKGCPTADKASKATRTATTYTPYRVI